MQALFPEHKLFGTITMFIFVGLTSVRLWFYFRKKLELGRKGSYLVVAFVGGVLVSYTGHLGGQMVHPDRGEFGPGMQGPNGQMRPQQITNP